MGWTGQLSGNLSSGSRSGENTPEQPVRHLSSLPTTEFSCLFDPRLNVMEEAAPAGSGTRLKWLSMALTETQRGEKKKNNNTTRVERTHGAR